MIAKLIEPHHVVASGLQRIFRIDDRRERQIRDDWGFAYNLYRNPRLTGDVDFLVSSDHWNQQKLRAVLTDFGFKTTLPPESQTLIEGDSRTLIRANLH